MPINLPESALRRIWAKTSGQPDTVALSRETRILKDYTKLRAAGMRAFHALPWSREAQKVRETVAALPESTFSRNGGQVWDFASDGWTYSVEIVQDDYAGRPEDNDDFFDADDIDAWERDLWHYYAVTVTASNGYAEGSDSLCGIDAGYYFEKLPTGLLDSDQQVWQVILDHNMLENAKLDAIDAFETTLRKVL